MDGYLAIAIHGELLTAHGITPRTISRGMAEMGLPHMAALQLLWARLYCVCGYWKGTTAVKFVMTKSKLA